MSESVHEKLVLNTLSSNEGSSEPGQMHRLTRIFAACILNLWMKMKTKLLSALRGYFAPPPPPIRSKHEIRFSPNSSYLFIRTMAQVCKSDISLSFTFAIVTKMDTKIGNCPF